MSFIQFYNFYKDFGIFPTIIKLIEVKNIFFALSDILIAHTNENFAKSKIFESVADIKSENKDEENKIRNLIKNKEVINFDLFLDSIAVTSTFLRFTEKFNESEKIIYLIEKMNKSDGNIKSLKKTGLTNNSFKDLNCIFALLREKYPEFYQKKLSHLPPKINTSFHSIFTIVN